MILIGLIIEAVLLALEIPVYIRRREDEDLFIILVSIPILLWLLGRMIMG